MEEIRYHIAKYGIFDSTVKFPGVSLTKDRQLCCFEFELFPASCPGTAYINGVAHKLEQGLLLCCKPGQYRHSRLPFRCCCLHLEVPPSPLHTQLAQLPDALYVDDVQDFAHLFYRMAAAMEEDVADSLLLHGCTDRILYRLLRHTRQCAPRTAAPAPHARILSQVREYIRENYSEPLSLAALAKEAALSPTYFHRLFTEYYGQTPFAYLLEVRIGAARERLLSTEESCAVIAAECGFSSQSYFTYSFRKQTGLSPMEYKKKTRIDLEP